MPDELNITFPEGSPKTKTAETSKDYSEVLVFSKNSGSDKNRILENPAAMDRRNPHDHAAGIDFKINEEFVRNGEDNFRPFHIVGDVKRSYLLKQAFRAITSLAAGDFAFYDSDGVRVSPERHEEIETIYESVGITHKDFIKPATCANYLFGGCPISLTWGSNGREFVLSDVLLRDYRTFRLSAPVQKNGRNVHEKHFFHKDWGWREIGKRKKVKPSRKTLSFLQHEQSTKKRKDEDVIYINAYDPELSLSNRTNRTQSYFLSDMDGLTNYYPLPFWYSGSAVNYAKVDFNISCFDIDDIKNGLHASGYVEVYHKSYKNPESGEAKDTFAKQKTLVEQKLKGSYNSGAVTVVPVDPDGKAVNGFMKFVPTGNTNTKGRHETLDRRMRAAILAANGAIYSELFGVRDEKSSFSEGSGKLIEGIKILNKNTIQPLTKMLDDKKCGFLNMVNVMLGIEERTKITPDFSAFLSIVGEDARHFLHPDQWFAMYESFGLKPPTEDQIESGLITAYQNQKTETNGAN